MSGKRAEARERMLADIRTVGRRHLVEHGAAALSLRAVARELGVVSSAVYRYVRSRDELLTLLLVDGYDELGDAVDAAVANVPEVEHRRRFLAAGHAVRRWARAEPATYALLFGSPVPGYEAPAERTTGPGTRVIGALVGLWAAAYAAGAVVPPTGTAPGSLTDDLAAIREGFGFEAPDELILRGVQAWTGLFGAVSFELFGQYGPDTFRDPDALFAHTLAVLAESLGYRED